MPTGRRVKLIVLLRDVRLFAAVLIKAMAYPSDETLNQQIL